MLGSELLEKGFHGAYDQPEYEPPCALMTLRSSRRLRSELNDLNKVSVLDVDSPNVKTGKPQVLLEGLNQCLWLQSRILGVGWLDL